MTRPTGWFEGRRATGPRPGRWFASEWGLAILALVLALLVWAVVWREIAKPDEPFRVELALRTPPGFTAYYEGDLELTLQGPRGEKDDARRVLGTPPVLLVRLPDLAVGEDHREVQITREMIAFPFPTRLVGSLDLMGSSRLPIADIYRLVDEQAVFADPVVNNVPPGIGYTVRMEPRSYQVRGPAGKVAQEDGRIQPDPIDLAAYFPEGSTDLPGETPLVCAFNQWRQSPQERRYRQAVELPTVRAVFTFHIEATREIENRLVFDVPPDYEVTAALTERYVSEGRYRGLFKGRKRDLDRLERSLDAWYFRVFIPPEKYPAEGDQEDLSGSVEFFRSGRLDDLQVELEVRENLVVTIKRREAP